MSKSQKMLLHIVDRENYLPQEEPIVEPPRSWEKRTDAWKPITYPKIPTVISVPSIPTPSNKTNVLVLDPNKLYTLIQLVIDCSGSMAVCKSDIIEAVNQLVEEQSDNETLISINTFNSQVKTLQEPCLCEKSVKLNTYNYVCYGSTSLLDAVGETLRNTDQFLETNNLTNNVRVVIVVATDGEENSSTKYVLSDIQNMVKKKEDTERYTFVFIGAGIDAWAEASKLGSNFYSNTISLDSTDDYKPTIKNLSRKLINYKSCSKTHSDNIWESADTRA